MMRILRGLVKKINNAFIIVLLFVVYYPTIGLCFIIYKTIKIFDEKEKSDTYWIDSTRNKFDKEYFKSSY